MSVTTTLKKISASTTGRRSGSYHAGAAGGPDTVAPLVERRTITAAVVGLSGIEKDKGCMGAGKSCLCNRFVRPGEDDYYTDHISVLSQTDFGGRVVNNDHFLYWGHVTKGTSPDIFSEMNQEFGMSSLSGLGSGMISSGVMGGGMLPLPPLPPGVAGVQTTFHVVEQTEFIDDSSFQPFKSGKTDPYVKRCAATKLTSAEKLMYICKNQLGIEKEYEQMLMPDGRLNVDGFICVFDVSDVPGRSVERVVEYTAACLGHLLKTKKPVVVAATKCDEADDAMQRELDRLLSRKEFKSANIPLVETSAHNAINVDTAFMVLAHLIDKARPGKVKVMTYQEALKCRQEMCDFAAEAYAALIRAQVNDYRTLWVTASKRIQHCSEFKRYVEIYGRDAAKRTFVQHTKRLKEQYIDSRVQGYLRALPDILLDLLPDLDAIKNTSWADVKEQLRHHPDFDQYFIDRPDESWEELILAGDDQNEDGLCDEDRVPFQLLETADAEQCYLQHRQSLEGEDRRNEQRRAFKKLLEETVFVTPGKSLVEVQVLFMGRDCYENLSEKDVQEVYDEHQQEITERAKKQFQELLLERAELFYDFANIGPGSVITQEDIQRITECLHEDIRYKTLERLDQERMLILLKHLGFVHGPIRECCPSGSDNRCVDRLISRVLQRAPRPRSWTRTSAWPLLYTDAGEQSLNIVLLATQPLLQKFTQYFKSECCSSVDQATGRLILELEKVRYALNLRLIEGDVSQPENSFRTSDFSPHGCICLYEDSSSLEYVRDSLEKTLLSNLEQDQEMLLLQQLSEAADSSITGDVVSRQSHHPYHGQAQSAPSGQPHQQPFHGLPIVLVLLCRDQSQQQPPRQGKATDARSAGVDSDDKTASAAAAAAAAAVTMREEGNNRARALQCPFVVVNYVACGNDSSDVETGDVSQSGNSAATSDGNPSAVGCSGYTLDRASVLLCVSQLIEAIQRRAGLMQLAATLGGGPAAALLSPQLASVSVDPPANVGTAGPPPADVKVLLCMLCGDAYDVERLLAPLLSHQCCCLMNDAPNTLVLEAYIGPMANDGIGVAASGPTEPVASVTRNTIVVQVQATSYHEAQQQLQRDELLHGFILAYSLERRASLATLTAFSKNISHVPIQIVALAGTSVNTSCTVSSQQQQPLQQQQQAGSGIRESDETGAAAREALLVDGEDVAHALQAHFICATSPLTPLSTTAYSAFFKDVYQCKGATERAFSPLCDGSCGDDLSGDYTDDDDDDEVEDDDEDHNDVDEVMANEAHPGHRRRTHVVHHPNAGLGQLTDPSQMATLPLRGYVVPPPPIRHDSYNQIASAGGEEANEGLYEQLPGESGLSPGEEDDETPGGYAHLYNSSAVTSTVTGGGAGISTGGGCHLSSGSGSGNNSMERPPQQQQQQQKQQRHQLQQAVPSVRPSAGEAPSYPPPLPPARNLAMSTFASASPRGAAAAENAYLISSNPPQAAELFHRTTQPQLLVTGGAALGAPGLLAGGQQSMAVRNLLLKKSSSLRAAPPPVVLPPARHSLDAGKALSEESPEDDTVSSGLSAGAYSAYPPPPDPAPPDLLPPAAGFRKGDAVSQESLSLETGWVDNRLYEQQRGGTSTFGHGSQTPDDSWERQQLEQLDVQFPSSQPHQLQHQRIPTSIAPGQTDAGELFQRFGGMFGIGGDSSTLSSPQGIESAHKFRQKPVGRINLREFDHLQNAIQRINVGGASPGGAEFPLGVLPRASQRAGTQQGVSYDDHQRRQYAALVPPHPNKRLPRSRDKAKTRLDGLSCVSGAVDDSLAPFDLNLELKQNLGEKRRKEKDKEKKEKRSKSKKGVHKKGVEDFAQSADKLVPLFVEKCINFIEKEGLDSEGLYRVPGNRAHVDLLLQKFEEDPSCDIVELDIPVNAVATALKDFFSKHLPPLLSTQAMNKLTDASAIPDRSCRLLEMRRLLRQLPAANFEILKFVFHHFVRVSENCRLNSMDSKNLAICWWPTLLPLEFNDMLMFERVRPHLEDSVQTLIDQYRFLFCGEEEVVMV